VTATQSCGGQPITGISIHAPVKGATCCGVVFNDFPEISIHAPVKGATRIHSISGIGSRYFNPRTREGCDVGTSARAASGADFNPRTREGCD